MRKKVDRKGFSRYLLLSLLRVRRQIRSDVQTADLPSQCHSKAPTRNAHSERSSGSLRRGWVVWPMVGTRVATTITLGEGAPNRYPRCCSGKNSLLPLVSELVAFTTGWEWALSAEGAKRAKLSCRFPPLSAAHLCLCHLRRALWMLMMSGALVGCSGAEARQASLSELQLHLRIGREVRLQEPVGVINVSPRVVPDRDGGFIVADAREGQIRIYSRSGYLEHRFGKHGNGPGEFGRIAAAGRLPSGLLVAADMGGEVTVFDSVGGRVLRTIRTPLAPLYNLTVIDDRRVALTGRVGGVLNSYLVHILDLQNGTIVRSFFRAPRPPRGFEAAYAFTGFADVAVCRDTAAVVWGLADTVYLFRLDGVPTGKVAMRSEHFRMLDEPLPTRASPARFVRWTESFSSTSRVFWSGKGFLVEYFDMVGHEPRWSLIHLARDGTVLFEIPDIPKLLTPTPADSGLVFIKPGSELPNIWSIAYTR